MLDYIVGHENNVIKELKMIGCCSLANGDAPIVLPCVEMA